MKTFQISDILGKQDPCTAPNFLGVFPSDRLIPPHQNIQFIVCNLDGHKFKGSHWICIYLEKTRKGYKGEYFCSFGQYPRVLNIEKYLNKYCYTWTFNKYPIQKVLTNTCGHHVIFYLSKRCRGFSMRTIVNHLLSKHDPDIYVYKHVIRNYKIKKT